MHHRDLFNWKNISLYLQNWVVEKWKQFIKVNIIKFTTILHSLQFSISFYFKDMTEYEWILRPIILSFVGYYRMHSKELLLVIINLGSMSMSRRGNNIGDLGIFLWQIGCEVHFFPSKFFFALYPWKSKFRS